ncbi:MAG: GDSL-type esterase/lipase family protein [Nocardiaceae bacterium]|nr:GDSL-type esterase/lipase family protein [Nocardiaceae bacterium]
MRRALINLFIFALVAGIAITISLLATPMQSVSAAGQTVRVGAAAPTWSMSGPGEIDLFGQQLPTTIDFFGPVRPKLELTRIELSPQLANLVEPGKGATAAQSLQESLIDGWTHYFAWQVAIVAVLAIALLAAIAGWRHISVRHTLAFIAIGLVITEAINVGAIMVTAYTAPSKLREVDSFQELVGIAPTMAAPVHEQQPNQSTDRIVVVGDSTAAGIGNPPLPNADQFDRACERSVDSFATALDQTDDWQVTNLACSSATVRDGLLGVQTRGDLSIEPQLPRAIAAGPKAIVISIGANDVNWSGVLQMCAVVDDCRNNALEAYWQQQLAVFTREYLMLLVWLRSIPEPPAVVVNLYYDPFGDDISCLEPLGITKDKVKVLKEHRDALNTVIANGATSADITVAKPDFTGHGVCSDQPYVQGIKAKAPMHPTAAGALAIALADQDALRTSLESSTPTSSPR